MRVVPVPLTAPATVALAVAGGAGSVAVADAQDFPTKPTFTLANTGPWGAAAFPTRQIAHATGVEYNNIPHDGGGPATLAVLGGHADATFSFAAQLMPHVSAGTMRALAVTDARRLRVLPDMPTLKEDGIEVTFTMWEWDDAAKVVATGMKK